MQDRPNCGTYETTAVFLAAADNSGDPPAVEVLDNATASVSVRLITTTTTTIGTHQLKITVTRSTYTKQFIDHTLNVLIIACQLERLSISATQEFTYIVEVSINPVDLVLSPTYEPVGCVNTVNYNLVSNPETSFLRIDQNGKLVVDESLITTAA